MTDTKARETFTGQLVPNKKPNAEAEMTDANARETSTAKLFTIKKLNVVAYWSWDVQSDNCAICRSAVMGKLYISYF